MISIKRFIKGSMACRIVIPALGRKGFQVGLYEKDGEYKPFIKGNSIPASLRLTVIKKERRKNDHKR